MRRYYRTGETVWLKETKTKATVLSLEIEDLQAKVSVKVPDGELLKTVKFEDMDKLKKATKKSQPKKEKKDTVLFAKVREDAVIPSKEVHNAGYDIYANIPFSKDGKREVRLHKNCSNLVKTGIAVSLLPKYYLNIKHERSSTGKYGMSILSGVVDSSYRGEILVNIVPLVKDIVITDEVSEVQEKADVIFYPYNKAICQGTIELVPDMNVKEITYEELLDIPSERGVNGWGSSGK